MNEESYLEHAQQSRNRDFKNKSESGEEPSFSEQTTDETGTDMQNQEDDMFENDNANNYSSRETDDSIESSPSREAHMPKQEGNDFTIRLSNSLAKKISQQAIEEGLTAEEFAVELLAEGVIVRAWEIVERKNQMRGQPSNGNSTQLGNRTGNGHQQYGRNGHNNQNQRKTHNRGGMSHTRYQSIMDDKATFLEYVRSQEKNRR